MDFVNKYGAGITAVGTTLTAAAASEAAHRQHVHNKEQRHAKRIDSLYSKRTGPEQYACDALRDGRNAKLVSSDLTNWTYEAQRNGYKQKYWGKFRDRKIVLDNENVLFLSTEKEFQSFKSKQEQKGFATKPNTQYASISSMFRKKEFDCYRGVQPEPLRFYVPKKPFLETPSGGAFIYILIAGGSLASLIAVRRIITGSWSFLTQNASLESKTSSELDVVVSFNKKEITYNQALLLLKRIHRIDADTALDLLNDNINDNIIDTEIHTVTRSAGDAE